MSVPTGKRSTSRLLFVQNARELLKYTITKTRRIPKSYTFTIGNKLVDIAWEIERNVKMAEAIWINNYSDFVTRTRYLQRAIGLCSYLQESVLVAYETLKTVEARTTPVKKAKSKKSQSPAEKLEDDPNMAISAKSCAYWSKLCSEEAKYIKGVIRADREKAKRKLGPSFNPNLSPEEAMSFLITELYDLVDLDMTDLDELSIDEITVNTEKSVDQ